MAAHKHKDVIIAWANGAQVQYQARTGFWRDAPNPPTWSPSVVYRVKPEGEREYPKNTLTDAELLVLINNIKLFDPRLAIRELQAAADEAIKRYIQEQENKAAT